MSTARRIHSRDASLEQATLLMHFAESRRNSDGSKGIGSSAERAIFVVGASSVGKTTLCKALASSLEVEPHRHIAEIARHVMNDSGFTREHVHLYEMQHAIMTAQLKAEQTILHDQSSHGSILLLSDRSAVDPIVYAAIAEAQSSKGNALRLRCDASFQSILPFYRKALFGTCRIFCDGSTAYTRSLCTIVVLQPVAEWLKDDGIRSLEDPWNYNIHLCSTLTELGIPFVEISAEMRDLTDRVEYVRGHLL